MASADPDTDWIQKLRDLRSGDGGVLGGSFSNTIEKLLFLPIIAFVVQAANALEALLNLVIVPVAALANGVEDFIGALFDGVARVIEAGARGSAAVEQFSLLGLPLAVAIVIVVAMILAWYTDQEFTSDIIPFTFTDLPIVGQDEEE